MRSGCCLWQRCCDQLDDELVSVAEMKDPLGKVLDED